MTFILVNKIVNPSWPSGNVTSFVIGRSRVQIPVVPKLFFLFFFFFSPLTYVPESVNYYFSIYVEISFFFSKIWSSIPLIRMHLVSHSNFYPDSKCLPYTDNVASAQSDPGATLSADFLDIGGNISSQIRLRGCTRWSVATLSACGKRQNFDRLAENDRNSTLSKKELR